MLTQARLTLRLHRFTLLSVAAILLLGSIAALVVAARLRALGVTTECLSSWSGMPMNGSSPTACQLNVNTFYEIDNSQASPLMGVLMWLAPITGLLAGVALVAREIEERTASVAWSLARSRTRWLVGRVVPVALVLVVFLAIAAVAGTELQRARQPQIDPLLSFDTDSGRGLVLITTGLMCFAAAVLIGSIVGRVLPALIFSAVMGLVLMTGASALKMAWLPSQAVTTTQQDWGTATGSLFIDQLLQLKSGEMVPLDGIDVSAVSGDPASGPVDGSTIVTRIVPGSRHPVVEAVVSAGMGLVASVLFVATAVVVRRRRPS
jgi:ABC-type transport system involved in multi-copper enzyme maturation permease subunit